MEQEDKNYFINQIYKSVSHLLNYSCGIADSHCIIFVFPLDNIVAIDGYLTLYTLGNGTDKTLDCSKADFSTLMKLNSVLDLMNKDIFPFEVKRFEWLEKHNKNKRVHLWYDTPIQ